VKVYLSGVISLGGILGPEAIAKNLQIFRDAEQVLASQGHVPLNPGSIDGQPDWHWRDWMKPALAMLLSAEAIALLPGWEQSPGARLEWEVARQLDYPVVTP